MFDIQKFITIFFEQLNFSFREKRPSTYITLKISAKKILIFKFYPLSRI